MPRNDGYNPTAEQQQDMDNLSFDRKYRVNAVEVLTENETGTEVVRQKPLATSDNQINSKQITKIKEVAPTDSTKTNPSFSITESTVGDVTTTTIVQTISGVSYTQTVAENNVTKAVTVSAWT